MTSTSTLPSHAPLERAFAIEIARVTERAGLGAWTTHELRHSAGSLLFAMGVPMKVISATRTGMPYQCGERRDWIAEATIETLNHSPLATKPVYRLS